jgi:hypothetical protein
MQKRKPRFKRSPTKNVQIMPRDVEVLKHVYKHRFLRSTHLAQLIGGSQQTLLRRLQLLYHSHYLDRPWEQIELYQRLGSKPMIYGLGNKGADLLTEELGIPRGKIDWTSKNREVGQQFLQHTLAVADVMVALEVACRNHGSLRLISAEEILEGAPAETRRARNPFGWSVNAEHNQERVSLGVMPDKVFGLHFLDAPEGKNRAFFFLEADRATMPVERHSFKQTSVFRKMVAYFATWKQGIHTKRFGIRNFRVLTVTTSPQRVGNLVAANRKLNNGQGTALFLFTEKQRISHDGILELEWRSGKDGMAVRLLD